MFDPLPSFMKNSCYLHDMANLQVRNFPDDLHAQLRRHARARNRSMSAVVLSAVERELARGAWRERLAQRPTTDLGVDAASLLAEERAARDAEAG